MSKIILRKRLSGHTTLSNNVIKILKYDLVALGLYVYLLSLPDDWEFYKTELCKACKIGIKKLEARLKTLEMHGLIKSGQDRNAKGQFERFNLEIFDTETPLAVDNFDKKEEKPVGQNCRTAKTVRRFREATKKEIQNKKINTKERGSASLNQKIKKDTFVYTREEQTEAIARDIDIQECIDKFFSHYGEDATLGLWLSWFRRENNGKHAKIKSSEQLRQERIDEQVIENNLAKLERMPTNIQELFN